MNLSYISNSDRNALRQPLRADSSSNNESFSETKRLRELLAAETLRADKSEISLAVTRAHLVSMTEQRDQWRERYLDGEEFWSRCIEAMAIITMPALRTIMECSLVARAIAAEAYEKIETHLTTREGIDLG